MSQLSKSNLKVSQLIHQIHSQQNFLEKQLQQFISQYLWSVEIPNQMEYRGLEKTTRADIITQDTVIEVKTFLTRPTLYKAYGQVKAYAKELQKPFCKILGLPPLYCSAKSLEATYRLAKRLNNSRVQIIFLDPFDDYLGLQKVFLISQKREICQLANSTLKTIQYTFKNICLVCQKIAESLMELAGKYLLAKLPSPSFENPYLNSQKQLDEEFLLYQEILGVAKQFFTLKGIPWDYVSITYYEQWWALVSIPVETMLLEQFYQIQINRLPGGENEITLFCVEDGDLPSSIFRELLSQRTCRHDKLKRLPKLL